MSQSLLTSFFPVRKKGDISEVKGKKRKHSEEEENVIQEFKSEGNISKEQLTVKNSELIIKQAETSNVKCEQTTNEKVKSSPRKQRCDGENPITTSASGRHVLENLQENTQVSLKEVDTTPSSSNTDLQKKVSFQKLSNLSPRKIISPYRRVASPHGKTTSPLKLDYNKLTKRLTPHRHADTVTPPATPPFSPAKRPAVSRNLFYDEPKLLARKASMAQAIADARQVKARLTPAEVKAKLGNVKLKDLKARLASLDSSSKAAASLGVSAKSGKITAKPELPSDTLTLSLNVPKTPKKVHEAQSPLKGIHKSSPFKQGPRASPKKVPAYERFYSLTKPLDRTLPLPFTYRVLVDVFRAVDTVVSMYFNRNEVITVPKLSMAVHDMTRRPFLNSYLPQIRCLFPEAYIYTWEKVERGNRITYSLQMVPNLSYKRSLMAGLGDSSVLQPSSDRLTSEQMVDRREVFANSLLQLVKDQHAVFLSKLQPPIKVDDNLITAWHRDFPVDSCAEIEEVPLPPHPEEEKVVSLKEDTKEDVFVKEEKENTVKVETAGLSLSLLEKIRAKEAAKAIREMTRTEADKKRIVQLRKLPGHARFMRTLLISERKASVPVSFAVTKLLPLCPHGTEKSDVEDELRTLVVESSGWLSLHRVSMEDIFKIAKPHRINEIVAKLEQKLSEALK